MVSWAGYALCIGCLVGVDKKRHPFYAVRVSRSFEARAQALSLDPL